MNHSHNSHTNKLFVLFIVLRTQSSILFLASHYPRLLSSSSASNKEIWALNGIIFIVVQILSSLLLLSNIVMFIFLWYLIKLIYLELEMMAALAPAKQNGRLA
jgi:hypothetical protein